MEKKDLICIGCPLGCMMRVEMDSGNVINVEGNTCKRGEVYAHKECTNPTRIVTSTVMVEDGYLKMVSVKTKSDIPKEKIGECMKELKGIIVKAPVKIGDIILAGTAGTNIDVIATKNVQKK